ncbi:hypothetical protein GWN75_14915 [candidate division KSB1 bacterium]|nr:hypothetical protein [candidate division KSB1 bacterium]NIS25084.1 hypothetical protein [candidate division KSB1 bacterium]NIU25783.1 hypothetical protein [candidate division KSB1 bacterium]NIU93772.1 hypothetical protein [candidate division KSB1 bacterium]NIW19637.1 hypothetical protein [candidate division KSB1 bacterium]
MSMLCKTWVTIVTCLWPLLLALNCGGTPSKQDSVAIQTRFEFGRSTTPSSLRQAIATVLHKFNHDLNRTESSIETEWRQIVPTESEQARGITAVRYKLFVNIKGRTALSTANLTLHYEAKHGESEWKKTDPSPEMMGFIKTMQDEVKQRLQIFLPHQ